MNEEESSLDIDRNTDIRSHEQALRTNYIKFRTESITGSDIWRLYCEIGQIVWQIVSECLKLAQNEHKKWHGNATRMIFRSYVEITTCKWQIHGMRNLQKYSPEMRIAYSLSTVDRCASSPFCHC